MSTPESLLKMESLEAVKQVLLDNLPAWVNKEWLVVENIRPKDAPFSKDALAEMTFSSFYAPPAISAKFKDPLTFQFSRLDLSEFLAGVDKTVKFKGMVSSVDILSRLLAKHEIPVSPADVELFTTEAAGDYVITAPSSSPRWVGSIALQLVREAYLLKEFFSNTAIYIPFSPSFRSDDFLKVLLKAIENHNSSYEEPYTLRPEDFRITEGPTVIEPDDTGLNTKITLTGVGGDFTGSMEFIYQRKSYTPTYRHAVKVATGGTPTREQVLDAINFKYDTGLVEGDIANWDSLPAHLVEKGVYRLITVDDSLTTVGDIYVELVIYDESNQIDLQTEIFDEVLDGFVLTHTCKMSLELLAKNKELDGFIPPYAKPDVSVCTTVPYLVGFDTVKRVPISEATANSYLVGFDTEKRKPISEHTPIPVLDGWDTEKKWVLPEVIDIPALDGFDSDKRKLLPEVFEDTSLTGFDSDKRKLLSEVLLITKLDGWDFDKGLPLSEVLAITKQVGFDSDKTKSLGNDLEITQQDGFDSDKLKLLPEVIVTPILDGFESDKLYLLSEQIQTPALDGFESDKLKLLTEVVGATADGFDGKVSHLLSQALPNPKLDGFDTDKQTKKLSEAITVPKLDGFEGKGPAPKDLTGLITKPVVEGLNYPEAPTNP